MNDEFFYKLERPDANLLKYYFCKSILSGPFFVLVFPLLLCRYMTLRYHVAEEGLSMRCGLIFRREMNLTYAKIQDIHLVSNVIQRWLGLADIYIQTASGGADAEMVIEGIREFEALRNFIYSRMRGYKDSGVRTSAPDAPDSESSGVPETELLKGVLEELKKARTALEGLSAKPAGKKTEDGQ